MIGINLFHLIKVLRYQSHLIQDACVEFAKDTKTSVIVVHVPSQKSKFCVIDFELATYISE